MGGRKQHSLPDHMGASHSHMPPPLPTGQQVTLVTALTDDSVLQAGGAAAAAVYIHFTLCMDGGKEGVEPVEGGACGALFRNPPGAAPAPI